MLLSLLDETCIRSKLMSCSSGHPEITEIILGILCSGSNEFIPVIKCLSILVERMGSRFWQFLNSKPKVLCEAIFSHSIFCDSIEKMSCRESDNEVEDSYSQLVYKRSLKSQNTGVPDDSVIFSWIAPFVHSLIDFGRHMSNDVSNIFRNVYELLARNDAGSHTVLYHEVVTILLRVSNLLYSKELYNVLLRCQQFWLPVLVESVDRLVEKNLILVSCVNKFFKKLLTSKTAQNLPDTDSFLPLFQTPHIKHSTTDVLKNVVSSKSLSDHVCRILKSLSSPGTMDGVLHDMPLVKLESRTVWLPQAKMDPSVKVKQEGNLLASVAVLKQCSVVVKKERSSSPKVKKIKSEEKLVSDISASVIANLESPIRCTPLPLSSESPSRKRQLSLRKHSKHVRYEQSDSKHPITLQSSQEQCSQQQIISASKPTLKVTPHSHNSEQIKSEVEKLNITSSVKETVSVDDCKPILRENSPSSDSSSDSELPSFLSLITTPMKKRDNTAIRSKIIEQSEKKSYVESLAVKRELGENDSREAFSVLKSPVTSKDDEQSVSRKHFSENFVSQQESKKLETNVANNDDATPLFIYLPPADIADLDVFSDNEPTSIKVSSCSSNKQLPPNKQCNISSPCGSVSECESIDISEPNVIDMARGREYVPKAAILKTTETNGSLSLPTEEQKPCRKSINTQFAIQKAQRAIIDVCGDEDVLKPCVKKKEEIIKLSPNKQYHISPPCDIESECESIDLTEPCTTRLSMARGEAYVSKASKENLSLYTEEQKICEKHINDDTQFSARKCELDKDMQDMYNKKQQTDHLWNVKKNSPVAQISLSEQQSRMQDVEMGEISPGSNSSNFSSPGYRVKMSHLSVDIVQCKLKGVLKKEEKAKIGCSPKELKLSRKLAKDQTAKTENDVDLTKSVSACKEQKKDTPSSPENTEGTVTLIGRKRKTIPPDSVSNTMPPLSLESCSSSPSKKMKLSSTSEDSSTQSTTINARTKTVHFLPGLVEPSGMIYSKKKAVLQKQFSADFNILSNKLISDHSLASSSSSYNCRQHFQQPFDNKATSELQKMPNDNPKQLPLRRPFSNNTQSVASSAMNEHSYTLPSSREMPTSLENSLSNSTRDLMNSISTAPCLSSTTSASRSQSAPNSTPHLQLHAQSRSRLPTINTKPTRLVTMNHLYSRILSWDPNPFLYPQQDEKSRRICPPCTEDIVTNLRPVPLTFLSYDEYIEVFAPLLLIELWEIVSYV